MTGAISVTTIRDLYEHNFLFTKSTSQRETLPGKRDNTSPYEQNENILDLAKCFLANRVNFCLYEQALKQSTIES